jgi:broad specificity phosphatase PhoE
MLAFYVTHPEIVVDPAVPVPRWHLSPIGRARAEAAARSDWAASLKRIVSSDETKAVETSAILAGAAGLAVEIGADMGENDRSATGFLKPDDFEAAANWFFAHPDQSFNGWERAIDAQARIVGAIDRVLADHDPALPIAFVGHGGVGTLLKCHLAGRPISRDQDQPAGGGNLFCFRLADRALLTDWVAMDRAEPVVGKLFFTTP